MFFSGCRLRFQIHIPQGPSVLFAPRGGRRPHAADGRVREGAARGRDPHEGGDGVDEGPAGGLRRQEGVPLRSSRRSRRRGVPRGQGGGGHGVLTTSKIPDVWVSMLQSFPPISKTDTRTFYPDSDPEPEFDPFQSTRQAGPRPPPADRRVVLLMMNREDRRPSCHSRPSEWNPTVIIAPDIAPQRLCPPNPKGTDKADIFREIPTVFSHRDRER